MDRKRKSVFSSHQDDELTAACAKKNHSTRSPNSSSLPNSSLDGKLTDDIQQLLALSDRIVAASEQGVVTPHLEILESGKSFCQALRKSPLFGEIPANSTRCDAEKPLQGPQSHGRRLPPLPPIDDDRLERAVFTHPGLSSDPKATYDRLEVLGDAYIELISTKLIYTKFQRMSSGRISQIRELLVKNEALAECATHYGLDRKASVPTHYFDQPKRWMKTKGDIFEAYVAAVVLSHPHGYAVAERWLSQLWLPTLESIEESQSDFQAKEALARQISGKGIQLKYIDEKEPVHHGGGTQTYYIGVYLTGWGWSNKHLGSGQGSNKKIAGNKAAQQALGNGDLIQDIIASKISYGTRTS